MLKHWKQYTYCVVCCISFTTLHTALVNVELDTFPTNLYCLAIDAGQDAVFSIMTHDHNGFHDTVSLQCNPIYLFIYLFTYLFCDFAILNNCDQSWNQNKNYLICPWSDLPDDPWNGATWGIWWQVWASSLL